MKRIKIPVLLAEKVADPEDEMLRGCVRGQGQGSRVKGQG